KPSTSGWASCGSRPTTRRRSPARYSCRAISDARLARPTSYPRLLHGPSLPADGVEMIDRTASLADRLANAVRDGFVDEGLGALNRLAEIGPRGEQRRDRR